MSDSREIELLKNEIKKERERLQGYKKCINRKDDEIIWVLEAKKFKKEVELKKCYQIQCTAVFNKAFAIRL